MAFVAYPATPDFHKFRISVNKSFGKQAGDYAEATRSLKRTYTGSIKLHGTNITILFTNSSRTPQFQSRNRIITPADDNQGAAKWLADTDLTPLLLEIFKIRGIQDGKFEEIFIAGEWAGAGIQSGVALTLVQRFFAIFNIRIDGHWVDIREYKTVQLLDRRIFNVANFTMYEIEFDLADTNDAKKALETMKAYTMEVSKTCPVGAELFALEAPDVATSKSKKVVQRNSTGEGIVWTMVPTPEDDTNLYNFKTKGEQFLTTTKATNNPNNRGTSMAKAEAFVDFALGE